MSLLALTPDTSVGFCHADLGCKFAYTGLHASNGIVKGSNNGNDTFYVADCVLGSITVLERQSDDILTFTEVIKTGLSSAWYFIISLTSFPVQIVDWTTWPLMPTEHSGQQVG